MYYFSKYNIFFLIFLFFNITGEKCGKIAVIGSGHMLSDKYINCEKNDRFREMIFNFLTTDNITLNNIDADDPEVSRNFKNVFVLFLL